MTIGYSVNYLPYGQMQEMLFSVYDSVSCVREHLQQHSFILIDSRNGIKDELIERIENENN